MNMSTRGPNSSSETSSTNKTLPSSELPSDQSPVQYTTGDRDSLSGQEEEPRSSSTLHVGLVDQSISEEELDQILEESDPQLKERLASLAADRTLTVQDIFWDEAQDEALLEFISSWKNAKGLKGFLARVIPFLPLMVLRLRNGRQKLWSSILKFRKKTQNFIYDWFFSSLRGMKNSLLDLKRRRTEQLRETKRNFHRLSWTMKLGFYSTLAGFALVIFFLYYSISEGLFSNDEELFLTSIEKVATAKFKYTYKEDFEYFYENLRVSQNIFHVPKVVANIKKSLSSGTNPMVAFDVYMECQASEVAIEIKDREVEIKDLLGREAEKFDFDELDSPEGKRDLMTRLKREINRILTTGFVKNVQLKTFILKP